MPTSSSFRVLLDAVEAYYGSGSDQWAAIAQYGIGAENAVQILSQTPGVNVVTNASGDILNFSITTDAVSSVTTLPEQIGNAINSNTQLSTSVNTSSVDIPVDMDILDGNVVMQSGSLTTGGTSVSSVIKQVAAPIAAVSVGITLGKAIDSAIYAVGSNIFDPDKMQAFNPEEWKKITAGNDGLSADLFNMVFGITPEGVQPYIDENTLAFMAMYMQSQGALEDAHKAINLNPAIAIDPSITQPINYVDGKVSILFSNGWTRYAYGVSSGDAPVHTCIIAAKPKGNYTYLFCSALPFTAYTRTFPSGSPSERITIGGESFYFYILSELPPIGTTAPDIVYKSGGVYYLDSSTSRRKSEQIAYLIMTGDKSSYIDGITTQPGAALPFLQDVTSIEDAKDKLREQYPQLWDNAITNTVVQPDGSTNTYTYVPSGFPNSDINGNPISGDATQNNTAVTPDSSPDSQDNITNSITNPPKDPNTGSGQTPPPILPTGSASSLWAIYNPTQGQLNQFGAWLWSDNFIDQIKKLFNDPMQAIIGVHKIFVIPPTGGSATIVCGYLDSGVPSKTVSSQYTTVSCGSVSLREYFGNVFDYNPYTEVSIYLPFIGIQRLDVDDVMRSTISVEYTVDVLTGACQAKVNVMRDSAGGTIYCYSGNCSVTYPISSGSYMGVVSAIASVAGTLVSAVATGGATAPLAVGAVSGLMHAKTNVQHSGSLSGNAGACGIKKPYLIISRPQTAMPAAYETIEGTSTNYTVKLGTCSGYTRVKEMHVEGVNCTASELADIERLLKEGVIL